MKEIPEFLSGTYAFADDSTQDGKRKLIIDKNQFKINQKGRDRFSNSIFFSENGQDYLVSNGIKAEATNVQFDTKDSFECDYNFSYTFTIDSNLVIKKFGNQPVFNIMPPLYFCVTREFRKGWVPIFIEKENEIIRVYRLHDDVIKKLKGKNEYQINQDLDDVDLAYYWKNKNDYFELYWELNRRKMTITAHNRK